MKISLYTVSYMGIWYDGPALSFEEIVKRAKDYGYDGVELDGKRPHGNPMDLDQRARERMRRLVEREGLEISCVAANNDFSSPVPEHRECQLLMVRELARLAADLGTKVVRLFAAWPGVVIRNGKATYELLRAPSLPYEAQYPFITRLDRWNFVKDCLKQAAAFGEEFGVVMALQNHPPFIRHWKDIYDLVREVNSPWLKICLDLPMMTRFDKESVKEAALTVGKLQTYSHFGGEYDRDASGRIHPRSIDFEKPIPDYAYFLGLMREIGYDGFFGYELCHPFLDDNHELRGIEQVHEQVKLAREYLGELIKAGASR
jgi:sugar phosphate isomerase/epimerase